MFSLKLFSCTALIIAIGLVVSLTTASRTPTQDYTHNVILDGHENYHLYWVYDEETITFEVHVKTNGWVGFGLSPNGGMPGSDIVMGWVLDGGDYRFTDRHATDFAEPIIDESQDYELLWAKEDGEFTILKFSRLLDTCDDYDWLITADTTRVIWAYHPDDPIDGEPIPKHTERGTKSLRLLSVPSEKVPEFGDDVKNFVLQNTNFRIPSIHTMYFCLGLEIPEFDGKQHMIGYEPIITPGNEAILHHILVYQCRRAVNESLHGYGHRCYTDKMPISFESCNSVIISWAIGGRGFYFPEHTGFSLGAEGDPTFVMLEIHYDNPSLIEGLIDNSGIRVYYTDQLRTYDSGVFTNGYEIGRRQMIPPGVPDYRTYVYCLEEHTKEGFVDRATHEVTNMNIFASFLHMHLLGNRMAVHQFRDNKEILVIHEENYYDFNYQEFYTLPEEVIVKPGDELSTVCSYDSTERDEITFGGLSTKDEMCASFLYFYPRTAIDLCLTHVQMESYARAIGIEEVRESLIEDTIVVLPEKWEGMTVREVFDSLEWTDEEVEALQAASKDGKMMTIAVGGYGNHTRFKRVEHFGIEVTETLPEEPRNCDDVGSISSASRLEFHAIMVMNVVISVAKVM